jgi:hypothetical protein
MKNHRHSIPGTSIFSLFLFLFRIQSFQLWFSFGEGRDALATSKQVQRCPRYNQDTRNIILFSFSLSYPELPALVFLFCEGRDALATTKQVQRHPCYNQDTRNLYLFPFSFSFPYPELPALVFLWRGQRRPRYIKTSTETPSLQQNKDIIYTMTVKIMLDLIIIIHYVSNITEQVQIGG